jgi:hypothetical protein
MQRQSRSQLKSLTNVMFRMSMQGFRRTELPLEMISTLAAVASSAERLVEGGLDRAAVAHPPHLVPAPWQKENGPQPGPTRTSVSCGVSPPAWLSDPAELPADICITSRPPPRLNRAFWRGENTSLSLLAPSCAKAWVVVGAADRSSTSSTDPLKLGVMLSTMETSRPPWVT